MQPQLALTFALVGIYAAWVFFPLVPAVLIFYFFPNTPVAVEGPLSSLSIRAGGAFGAYLIVVLVGWPLVGRTAETVAGTEYLTWHLDAEIQVQNSKGEAVDDPALLRQLNIDMPETHSVTGAYVALSVPELGQQRLPHVKFEIPGYGTNSFALDDRKILQIDSFSRKLHARYPIIIKGTGFTTPYMVKTESMAITNPQNYPGR
jgi:hypothetical protein